MKKTIVELFAGVGGFRLGFEKASKDWKTVWMNQWEPLKKNQHAFECYKYHFNQHGGINHLSNIDISKVEESSIPKHNLLVGGFPCQDYSVAATKSKGIEGKKGVLWWEIKRIISKNKPPFILLENVDRLIKSPTSQRGRDFGVMLACLNNLGYGVEWRVINAEDYGLQQRRRRIFIFAFNKNTKYYKKFSHIKSDFNQYFFTKSFPAKVEKESINIKLSKNLLDISKNFKYSFENSGCMYKGNVFTVKAIPKIKTISKKKTLLSLLEENVSEKYYLDANSYERFKYFKGAKKEKRTTKDGYVYKFEEGSMSFPDILDRAARTILTSESSLNRSSHIVKDKKTGKLRKLTPVECERINGFPDDWTSTGMPNKFRYFCMGNALVVDLVEIIAKNLDIVFNEETN